MSLAKYQNWYTYTFLIYKFSFALQLFKNICLDASSKLSQKVINLKKKTKKRQSCLIKIDSENKPFLIEGKLKSFTSPKSSPVAQTCRLKQASAELTSFIEVYFGQIPFTSGPRTEVHVDHFIVDMTSASKSCWPPV